MHQRGFFRWRMRLGLRAHQWRLPECPRNTLPPAVILNRLAAPRCVFNFSFGFDLFLGTILSFAFSSLRRLACLRPAAGLARRAAALFGRQQSHQDVRFHPRPQLHQRVSVISFSRRSILARPTS